MYELALFSGAGGGILGSKLLGIETVCAVEIEPYNIAVLIQRQNDGILPIFPIWDDIRTFNGRPWRGIIELVSGGFPCEDISIAGKGAGISGNRSGLWNEMFRIIREVRPAYIFLENSPMLVRRGLGVVLRDLASVGFNAEWGVLGANDTGAPHYRKRIWILGYSYKNDRRFGFERKYRKTPEKQKAAQRLQNPIEFTGPGSRSSIVAEENFRAGQSGRRTTAFQRGSANLRNRKWPVEPEVGRMAYGVARRMDRIKALGNGQVPRVVRLALLLLKNSLNK
ncbi:DNA cytosine methyltransferase [Leptospira licerasiae]|uniref:DNA cytosine methyltransferase n=1 Tax=Leptospira licerasiae TaxID=447106 RepID=UPI0010840519|nr:DNA cytosine methyltransferase [Leptospira licerasiae]TGM87899.1 DNA cytosine methyltransferase [Leptospira licerasiae]